MRTLQTQKSYFERFTQQISSVLTEQSQAGVKSSVSGRERDLTSERFVTKKKKEQLLKKPQEVNSLVQTPRSNDPVSGKRLRECLQNFETLEKEIQSTKVCEDASFWKRVSIGMFYKAIADVDDGLGDRTPACREKNTPSC